MAGEIAVLDPTMEERPAFETMLSGLFSRFVNLEPGDVDLEIENAQRRVCECLGLDLSGTQVVYGVAPGP